MNLTEYQRLSRETAIYTDIYGAKIIYPAIGLLGECGEVANKIKKFIRNGSWTIPEDSTVSIANELGDCCWYAANICEDIDRDLQMMYDMRGYNLYHATKSSTLISLVSGLCSCASKISSALICQDMSMKIKIDTNTTYNLSALMSKIEALGEKCGYSLMEICQMNLDKLAGRKRRQTIKGDGDER